MTLTTELIHAIESANATLAEDVNEIFHEISDQDIANMLFAKHPEYEHIAFEAEAIVQNRTISIRFRRPVVFRSDENETWDEFIKTYRSITAYHNTNPRTHNITVCASKIGDVIFKSVICQVWIEGDSRVSTGWYNAIAMARKAHEQGKKFTISQTLESDQLVGTAIIE